MIPESGLYSTGSVYEAQARAHIWHVYMCMYTGVCMERGMLTAGQYTHMEAPEAINTGPNRQQCLYTRLLEPVIIQGLLGRSLERSQQSPCLTCLSFNF